MLSEQLVRSMGCELAEAMMDSTPDTWDQLIDITHVTLKYMPDQLGPVLSMAHAHTLSRVSVDTVAPATEGDIFQSTKPIDPPPSSNAHNQHLMDLAQFLKAARDVHYRGD